MTSTLPATRHVDVGGHRLAYDEITPQHPKGNILLLQGLGGKRQGWARQLPVFGREYRTIALDHRDVGDSDPYPGEYGTKDQADDAAALLRALNAAPAHVMGISMGGFVALELALRHPDLVASLVLIGTSAGGATHVGPTPEAAAILKPDFETEVGERVLRNFHLMCAPGYFDSRPDEAEIIAQTARHNPMSPDAYRRQYAAARAHDVTQRLGEIHVPTLVVHGDVDPLVPIENGYHLAEQIPNAQLRVYHNVGHIPIMERAREFNDDALQFIASIQKEHA